jgi:protein SCO1/2
VPALPARAADKFRLRYPTVREPGSDNYAVDHSSGIILLGSDGQFIKKFAFATPLEKVTAQLVEILDEYPVTPTWGR